MSILSILLNMETYRRNEKAIKVKKLNAPPPENATFSDSRRSRERAAKIRERLLSLITEDQSIAADFVPYFDESITLRAISMNLDKMAKDGLINKYSGNRGEQMKQPNLYWKLSDEEKANTKH